MTGIIRETRKQFPPELKRVNLNREGSAYFEHDDIVVIKHKAHQDRSTGKATVGHFLMTAYKPLQANTSKSDRDGSTMQKQSSIIDYNYNMGGVDMVDKQLINIEVLRKSYKWYKKLFRLLMQCVLASHKNTSNRQHNSTHCQKSLARKKRSSRLQQHEVKSKKM